MPLFNSLSEAGDGIITNADTSTRRYSVEENGATNYYRELDITETRLWVGLTRFAAYNAVSANEQPSDRNVVYSWSMREDQRTIGSYVVERTSARKSIVADSENNVPSLSAPTFNPEGQLKSGDLYFNTLPNPVYNISSFPFTVQMRSTTANTNIYYFWHRYITRSISGVDTEFMVRSNENGFIDAGSNAAASVTFTQPTYSWKIPNTSTRTFHFVLAARTIFTKSDGTKYSSATTEAIFTKEA